MNFLQSGWLCSLIGALAYCGVTIVAFRVPATPAAAPVPPPPIIGHTPTASWNFHTTEIDQLVIDLQRQREQLNAREKQLRELETRLTVERQEIMGVTQVVARVQQQVEQKQKDLDQSILRIQQDETPSLKRLAKLYATMTPESVATLFKEMPDDEIVKVLTFMKDDVTAPILELLTKTDAKRAMQLTDRLRTTTTKPKA